MKPASALQSLECILIFCEPQWCNGVPLPATLDASIEACRPRGTHLGASETPAPAALPFAAVSMDAGGSTDGGATFEAMLWDAVNVPIEHAGSEWMGDEELSRTPTLNPKSNPNPDPNRVPSPM